MCHLILRPYAPPDASLPGALCLGNWRALRKHNLLLGVSMWSCYSMTHWTATTFHISAAQTSSANFFPGNFYHSCVLPTASHSCKDHNFPTQQAVNFQTTVMRYSAGGGLRED